MLGLIWSLLTTYRPNAASERNRRAQRYGAFAPTYYTKIWRRPKNDREAQNLYNHVRTMAFALDAAPLLSDLGLPFRAGLDDVISLIPIYGDILSGILGLYQVFLCWVFGMSLEVVGKMFVNVILDVLVGLVPFIGDILDNLFKSNLRNLAILEDWLLSDSPKAQQYHILLMPDSTTFLPEPKKGRWSNWFGSSTRVSEDEEERQRERLTGQVRKTRRMDTSEAAWVPEGGAGVNGTTREGPAQDPLD